MTTRLLSVDDLNQYKDNLIEEYPLWFLLLNEDQRLIGRCYVWYRVAGEMQDLPFISSEALLELQLIMQAWSLTMRQLFGMAHPNYEWLGNEIQHHQGHGHLHMVPRYVAPFEFMGETCFDPNFQSDQGTRHDAYVDGKKLQKRPLSPLRKHNLIQLIKTNFQMFG